MYSLFASLLWALAAAAAAGVWPAESLPAAHHIVGVPLAEQRPDWCGPAALAAVLQYHEEEVAAEEIAGDIYLPGYRGSLNIDLLLWARRRGFEVWTGALSEEGLKRTLCRDRPVIAMVRKRGPLVDRNHFVVVRGYDDRQRVWFVDAGEGQERAVGAGDFERDSRECGGWMMVVEERKAAQPDVDDAGG